MADHKCGDLIGNCRLLIHCGTGAYGSVFFARDIFSGKAYALKILFDSDFREREINGLRQYQKVCPQTNLMQIYHIGETDGVFYYTMDAADNLSPDPGQYEADTLQNRLKRYGRIKSSELLDIALQLEQDLNTLHSKGVLHRDIKPANIIFINGSAVPGDIGMITGQTDASLAGTAAFISPQTAAGLRSFCGEDDFYALGKTVYCALTGYPPEKYPAFPEDLDLTENKELITLYNRWISGSRPDRSAGKRQRYILLLAVLTSVILAILLLFFASTPSGSTFDIHSYKKKTAPFCESLVPDEKMQKILPLLQQEKKDLSAGRIQAGTSAFQRKISPDELKEAQKDPRCGSDPEYFLRIQHKDNAVAAFDKKHKKNLAVRYYSIMSWFKEELQRIESLAQVPGIESTDFSADWNIFQKKFSEFEDIRRKLLQKY